MSWILKLDMAKVNKAIWIILAGINKNRNLLGTSMGYKETKLPEIKLACSKYQVTAS